jgi:hypothetical protein
MALKCFKLAIGYQFGGSLVLRSHGGWGSAPLTHPDRGHLKEIIEQAFPERSRTGAPLDSWKIIEFYGGWGSATLTHPDRGYSKEIIEQAFPERSRMGAPLDSWKIIEFNEGWGSATLTHPRSRKSQGNY